MKSKRSAADAGHDRIGHGRGAHLGGQVVRRHLAVGRNQHPFLPGKRRLDAAVEEIRDVGVLLGLRHVELSLSEPGQVGGKGVQLQRSEGHGHRKLARRLVLGQRRHREVGGHLAAVEGIECRNRQGSRQLTGAIGPKVEMDHGIAGAHTREVADDGRPDEFVALVTCIRRADGSGPVSSPLPRPVDDRVVREPGSIPARVAVHGVVAPGQRGQRGTPGDPREQRQAGTRRPSAEACLARR